MSITYRKHELFPKSLLIRDFKGSVGIDEIINSWEYLINNKLITPTIKGTINNLTGCDLKMDLSSFSLLMEYIKKKETLSYIKLAVICNCPKTIVFPTLGENEVKELKIKPFTTIEAAVNWIINE